MSKYAQTVKHKKVLSIVAAHLRIGLINVILGPFSKILRLDVSIPHTVIYSQ